MIDKEFVPYEQALALKELGFDEPCFGKYDIYGVFDHKLFYHNHDADTILNCSAPTFSQCFRWFRDKKLSDMCICRYQSRDDGGIYYYYYHITHDFGIEETKHFKEGFISYEEAELACLIKLIQIIKDGNK